VCQSRNMSDWIDAIYCAIIISGMQSILLRLLHQWRHTGVTKKHNFHYVMFDYMFVFAQEVVDSSLTGPKEA